MNKYNLKNFTKGWFIGDFENSLLKTTVFEVAVKYYKKGDKENSHYHRIATEYTIFNSGKFKMQGKICEVGEIIEILPGESSDFECLENGNTTVVKVPSVIGDKYID